MARQARKQTDPQAPSPEVGGLHVGDCRHLLPRWIEAGVRADLVIADPPYNISRQYQGEYDDALSPQAYTAFSRDWLSFVYKILADNGTFWLVIGDEWVADLRILARELGFHLRNWIVWYYSFGVRCTTKFSRSHAHLLYFVKDPANFTWAPPLIPSARAAVYKDVRAAEGGKMPDDTWIFRPSQVPEAFQAHEDTWCLSRVCGTFQERVPGADNQLPERLIGRIVTACSSPGMRVLDPMAGTGTVLAVAKKLGRAYLGCEQSCKYAALAQARIEKASVGEVLAGAVPHGG